MKQHNRIRALADVVGVEAWHQGFSPKGGKAKLHIDVVFGEARLDGDADDAVQFRLAIKRAEVVVVIPPGELIDVAPGSVVRDAPKFEGDLTVKDVKEKQSDAGLSVGLGGDAAKAHVKGKFKASGALKRNAARQEVLRAHAKLAGFNLKHMKTGDGQHRWIVSPDIGDNLDGRPWNSDKPRLTLTDCRADRSKGIAPTVRVEVRCRREDLEISDIKFKKPERQIAFLKRDGQRNRMVAAEALIRSRLIAEGLMQAPADLGDEFLELTLADAIVEG